ncbi:histone-fold-containing protein [Lipomyces kononenkoae]|uniref:Histone-fold-containing protein n=1 Tax=Lipomyces kononenkoae TaxID=34357 RepID=A0ACC3SYJ3_LIPKO
MPRGVKKSTTSAATAGTAAAAEGTPGEATRHAQERERAYGIDDYMLPKATVTRLAKHVLPANMQIQKDAMTALSKSATVFINYLTATANDLTVGAGRRTVNPSDVYKAIELLELEFILPRLKAEVDKYVEVIGTKHKKPTTKVETIGTVADESEIVVPGQDRTDDGGEEDSGRPVPIVAEEDQDQDGEGRTTKKAKVGNGKGVARQPSVQDEEETEVEDTEDDEAEEEEDDDGGDDDDDDPAEERQADGSSAEDAFEDAQDRMDEDDNEDGPLEMTDSATVTLFRDRVLAKDPDALSGSDDDDDDDDSD